MHDIGCEHADVWSCSGNTYLLELGHSPVRRAPRQTAVPASGLRAARR